MKTQVPWWMRPLPILVTNRLLAERQSLLAGDIARLSEALLKPAVVITPGKPIDEEK